MSVRNLDFVFKPRTVALIGASKEPNSIGAVVARNLFKSGFDGPIMPVHPEHRAIEGVLTYPDIQALPEVPDLAVLATPPETLPKLIAELGQRGTRGVVVITAGFGKGSDSVDKDLHQQLLDAARPHILRIVGPNCLGVMVPKIGLNASFAPASPLFGHLAFVAQSGAIMTTVLDWANARGIGFCHFVSLGDKIDVDVGDMLDYLGGDPDVRGILLYIETISNARKFMSAARVAARVKPVIVVKAGRTALDARTVPADTGVLARTDAIYDAAIRRAGMLRVFDLEGLFGAVETLGMGRAPKGDRLAILTNGGALGVIAADTLGDYGCRLAELSEETKEALDAFLPPTWSHGNPVDIVGDAPGERYARSLEVLLKDKGTDAVLVLNCPNAVASGTDAAKAVVGAVGKSRACVLTSWLGEKTPREARQLFGENRIPTYFTPERGVRAFIDMVNYRRNQEMLIQTPPSIPEDFEPDAAAARKIITRALENHDDWLTEADSKGVLSAYGIPITPVWAAKDAEAAAAAAEALGGAIALKILSPDIRHKSDVGGVVLDLRDPDEVRQAADRMLMRVREKRPSARIEGLTIQPMIDKPEAHELIVGVNVDPEFGPVILFGHGGLAVEILEDTAVALPPLNMSLARDLMARTRVHGLLQGIRGQPPAALDDIALTLIKVSQLIIDFAEVVELAINPLLADSTGVIALDAKIRVQPAEELPTHRLAIRPYPKALEEIIALPDGRKLLLRPVRPEDEPALRKMYDRMTPEDLRLRFFSAKKAVGRELAARLTQIDYDREMALVLTQPEPVGPGEIYGGVRISADPDGEKAEYAISLRSDMAGQGLGPMLMRRIIDYSRQRGIQQIFGTVLRENRPMLKVCERLGFSHHIDFDDPGVVEVQLDLQRHGRST